MGQCRRWSKQRKEYININMPEIVKKYNDKMGEADMLDWVIAAYMQNAKSKEMDCPIDPSYV